MGCMNRKLQEGDDIILLNVIFSSIPILLSDIMHYLDLGIIFEINMFITNLSQEMLRIFD